MSTFTELYSAVTDQLGDTSTSTTTRVKRYINWTQQDIASRRNWPFLLERSSIQCIAPYSTGEVSVTDGDATVTGSGTTFTAAMVGRKIRFNGQAEYYTIATFTSDTALELDQTYSGTSDANATYSIYKDEYSLAATAEKIVNITLPSKNYRLANVGRTEFDTSLPSPKSEGAPDFWVDAGTDSNNYLLIQLSPIPDDDYVVYYWYRKRLTDLSADADVSLIPTKYHKLLYLGGCAQTYEQDENPIANNYWTQYENMIEEMKSDLGSGAEDSVLVLRSIDELGPVSVSKLRLPPEHFRN
jgi:hypothetical protein